MRTYLKDQNVPVITVSKEGMNQDQHLEDLFDAIRKNDLSDKEVMLHYLMAYATGLCGESAPADNWDVLDNTDAALEWACSISALTIWKLEPDLKQMVKDNFEYDHDWGAFLASDDDPPLWVSAASLRLTILAAVVQRFREHVAPILNPEVPSKDKLQ